jgi:hypothetical protein
MAGSGALDASQVYRNSGPRASVRCIAVNIKCLLAIYKEDVGNFRYQTSLRESQVKAAVVASSAQVMRPPNG